ncbi:ribosomal protection-like ABC-F family protein [Ornithinibacillus scapharcae]|uniref:ribosomal protection-like ABC-F family protein n=1 Tax=Ornithinibacillus scapharcae TaxID=1147159 RepID=UPI000225C106|nr:ABC-F type ribosomal protection protein [Ornithinibacillus scapharcae]
MGKVIMELKEINIGFEGRDILNIDYLTVTQFDRIGIVGKNGVGKSTLLKLLSGIIQPERGTCKQYIQPAYFEQLTPPSTHLEADGEILSRIGVSSLKKEQHKLSGGEETKLKLVQIFSRFHEAILLDEPTTHLDQTGKDFLIEQLDYFYGALILVSHDRDLLDRLVSEIWEIADGKVTVYKGNYSDYQQAKQLEIQQHIDAYEAFSKERSRLERAAQVKMEKADRLFRNGGKFKQKAKEKPSRLGKTKSKATSQKSLHRASKSIENRISKLSEVEMYKKEQPIVFQQSKAVELHNRYPIMADRLTIRLQDTILLEDVSFQIPLGAKVVITGPNGSGKSTLLRYLLSQQSGITVSPKAKIGYFEQLSYRLITEESVLSFLKNRTTHEEGFLRTVLSKMHFTGSDLQKKVNVLSGGEVIRLQLCYLFLGEYNILLLDEPTNFLDVQTMEALEEFILGYNGTILLVTHDATMVDRIADVHFQLNPMSRSISKLK